MNAIALPGTSLGRQALRSAATNLPLAGAVVAAFASIHAMLGVQTPGMRRRAFLRSLATAEELPDGTLLEYLDARDPLAKAKADLRCSGRADPQRMALRRALAAAL